MGGLGKGQGKVAGKGKGLKGVYVEPGHASLSASFAKGKGKTKTLGLGEWPMGKGKGKGTLPEAMKGKGKTPKGKGKTGRGGKAAVKGLVKGKGKKGAGKAPVKGAGKAAKGAGKAASKGKGEPDSKGKGKGKSVASATPGKGKHSPAKGASAQSPGKGQPAGKGKGKGKDGQLGDESRGKRVPRLAAELAGCISDLLEGKFTYDQFWYVFEDFCQQRGYPSTGFSTVWYLMERWRVIVHADGGKYKLLTQSNFRGRTPTDSVGALDGQKPPLLAQEFTSPVPFYPLPRKLESLTALEVYKMQAAARKVLLAEGLQPGQLEARYKDYQHHLLYVEELQMKFDIALYDLEVDTRLDYLRKEKLHKIFVPGLAEKRPSILRGDTVLLTCQQGKFRGYVHNLLLDQIHVSFHETFANKPPFKIHFSFNRTPLRSMHRAVDDLKFPVDGAAPIVRPRPRGHPDLNQQQTEFFAAVTARAGSPLFLWGPPGTGKTTTLTHTIHAVLKAQRSARILVSAPSNPASDLLCSRLAGLGVRSSEMLRLVAVMRDVRDIPASVLPFTRTDPVSRCFQIPSLEELQGYQIVVCTCTTASYIRSRLRQGQGGWFTHVFVDEAAQSVEAEALVPITLRTDRATICLAGDFKQLGPVIRSPVAIDYGLQTSLMERLVNKITVDHSRVFTLLDTYRSHPSILQLYNKLVYANVLKCCCPHDSYSMTTWPECPGSGMNRHPIIFHHCNGTESRQKDSPSWQNVEEGDIIKMYLMKLMEHGVDPDDIGIISPYHKQCVRLRYICRGEGLDIEVGTTELFQGQEKKVILISTVRSRQEQEIKNDIRFSLGFLGNYKRTNVAISRAKSLLIVVGNMTLLSHDASWLGAIKLAKEMGCLRGAPFELSDGRLGESSEWRGSFAPRPTEIVADGATDREWRDQL
eukprot:s292_g6.t1